MIFVVHFDPTLIQCIRTHKSSQHGRVSFQIFEVMAVGLAYVIYQNLNFEHDVTASDLSQESKGLEALELQMSRNFEALKERREHDKFSGTLKGKIFNWGGQLFAIYCVFRVISVSNNVIFEDN